MREYLDDASRRALIAYRLERADQTLEEAEAMAGLKYYNASVNRLYYAVFYATLALLLSRKISARTHAGVRSMLGLHFVSKGVLPKEYGRTFSDLFALRHSGDYDDFVSCDKETVDEYIPKAKDYVAEVKSLIQ